VARHPDKRPASRPEKDRSLSIASVCSPNALDRQPEAKPAPPALNGGRGLKQRRTGLPWSLPAFHRRRGYRRGLFIIAGRAEWDLPTPIQGSIAGREPTCARVRPHRAPRNEFTARITGGSPPASHGESALMTARIRQFLRKRAEDGPCLVVDL